MPSNQQRVIIVDDDRAVREALQFALQAEGFRVSVCSGGAELLAHPALRQAGCLIIDHNRLKMDGFAILARLVAEAVTVPVIMMTAHATASFCRMATMAGVRHVIEKPLLDGALADLVHRLFAADGNAGRYVEPLRT